MRSKNVGPEGSLDSPVSPMSNSPKDDGPTPSYKNYLKTGVPTKKKTSKFQGPRISNAPKIKKTGISAFQRKQDEISENKSQVSSMNQPPPDFSTIIKKNMEPNTGVVISNNNRKKFVKLTDRAPKVKVKIKTGDYEKFGLTPKVNQIVPMDSKISKTSDKNTLNPNILNKSASLMRKSHQIDFYQRKTLTPINPNPSGRAGCLSKLFFSWINGLFDAGHKKVLKEHEIFSMNPKLEAKNLLKEFEDFLEKSPRDVKHNTIDIVYAFIRPKYLIATALFILSMSSQFFSPLIMKSFLKSLAGDNALVECPIIIFILFITLVLRAFLRVHSKARFNECATILSQILRSLMMKKILQFNYVYAPHYSSSILSNLMTVDVDSVTNGLQVWPNFWGAGLIILSSVYSLVDGLGFSSLIVLGVILLCVILQRFIYMKSKYIRSYILFQNDERARIFSELIENISSVKLGIYESKFYQRFKKER
jgi:hypothetical protein